MGGFVGEAGQFELQILVLALERVGTRLLQLGRLTHRESERPIARLGFQPRLDMRQIGPHQPGEQHQQQEQQGRQQQPLPPHGTRAGRDGGGGHQHGLRRRSGGGGRWHDGRGGQEDAGQVGFGREAPEGHDRPAVHDVERVLARRGQRMAQQLGEVVFGIGARRRFHLLRETTDLGMQALDVGQNILAFAFVEIGKLAWRAFEGRVPVDAPSGRIDFGDGQQVGMLARQPGGNGGAQLTGRTPYRIAGHAERPVALQRFTDQKGTGGHLESFSAGRPWSTSTASPTSRLLR